MAYGNYCRCCGGTVDNSEYDFTKDMCKECVVEKEMEDIRRADIAKIMNAEFEQIRLEDMISSGY